MPRRTAFLRRCVVVAGGALSVSLAAAAADAAGKPAVPPFPATDLLLLRDGGVQKGTLQACVADRCQFAGKAYDRAEIRWIGLAVTRAHPPRVGFPDEDEVHLADGSVQPGGQLVGVSLGEVVADKGSWERTAVRWIHLQPPPGAPAGEIEEPEEPGQQEGPHEGGGSGGGTGREPPGAAAPGGGRHGGPAPQGGSGGRPPAAPSGRGEKGGLWQGKLHALWTSHESGQITIRTEAQVRYREYKSPILGPPSGQRIGTFVALEHEGTEVGEDFQSVIPGAGSSSGHGSCAISTLPGQAGVAHGSALYLKSTAADSTPAVGFDIPRPGGRYWFGVSSPTCTYTVHGVFNGQPVTEEHRLLPTGAGRLPLGPHTLWNEDPQLRALDPGEGVMKGEFHVSDPQSTEELRVRWAICREGVHCVEPPAFGNESGDSCPSTAAADGLYDVCADQYNAMIDQLKDAWNAAQAEWRETGDRLEAYRAAIAACAIWDIAEKIAEYLVENYDTAHPPAGTSSQEAEKIRREAEEWRKAIKFYSDFVAKASQGENAAGVFSPSDLGAPEIADQLKEAGEEILELTALFKGITPQSMGEKLEECNAPLPESLRRGAEEYVEHLKEALAKMQEVRKLSNDLRQKGLACLDLQYKSYAACIQRARCLGEPESSCDAKKPPGHWPDVP